jgi:hypothetical protein
VSVFACEWVAVLGEQANILSEEAIEDWPATVAAFVYVVALDQLLHWKVSDHCDSVSHSESVLYDLNESVGVWGSASFLVSDFACIVNSANVSQIKGSWNVCFRDSLCVFILLILLNFFMSFLKGCFIYWLLCDIYILTDDLWEWLFATVVG